MQIKKSLVKYPFLTRDVEVYELENGHKIVLAHKEGGMVNVSSWVKTGSINEDDNNNGISHFLEHLMFKGTKKHPAGEFDRILEAKGAIVNAATWKDYTFYYVTLPKGENNKDFYEAIELHVDMMLDPILPEDEIGAIFDINDENVKDKRERHVVIEEIRMRQDQPWTKAYNEMNHAMYKNHPYKRDVIGTPEIISQVTQQTIMDYYKTHYTPENITTIIVGDFNHEEILKKVCSEFEGNWKSEEKKEKQTRELDKPTSETIYIEKTSQINSAFLMMGYLAAPASDLESSISLEILSIILGEGISSRMHQNLIEKQGGEKSDGSQIFNMAGSGVYQFKDGDNFLVQANFNPEKKDLAIELIKDEIQKIIDEKVLEEELSKAKKKIKSRFAQEAETVSEIGDTIGYYMTVCDDLSPIEQYLEILDSITTDVLQQKAKEYLQIQNSVISVLMPEA